jgi:hypothetical protein
MRHPPQSLVSALQGAERLPHGIVIRTSCRIEADGVRIEGHIGVAKET